MAKIQPDVFSGHIQVTPVLCRHTRACTAFISQESHTAFAAVVPVLLHRDGQPAQIERGFVLLIVAAIYLRDPTPVEIPTGQTFGTFLASVGQSLLNVARMPHVWMASGFGALSFGVMLGLGVVWGPKLLMVRGQEAGTANVAASFLWLGLAAGCFVTPWISDHLRRRKLPILIGIAIQILALALLLYTKPMGAAVDVLLCFLFGFGNSAHMLAFSTAGDVGACIAFVIALLMRETYPRKQGTSQ